MHKIYFEKRCLLICPPDEQVLTNPNAMLVNINERSQVHDLINMFEVSDSLGLVYIPSEDTERTYRLICDEFKEVNAGGGLVRNRRGDYLLRKRNGLWDLPKGHQEDGEDIQKKANEGLLEIAEKLKIKTIKPHHTSQAVYSPTLNMLFQSIKILALLLILLLVFLHLSLYTVS